MHFLCFLNQFSTATVDTTYSNRNWSGSLSTHSVVPQRWWQGQGSLVLMVVTTDALIGPQLLSDTRNTQATNKEGQRHLGSFSRFRLRRFLHINLREWGWGGVGVGGVWGCGCGCGCECGVGVGVKSQSKYHGHVRIKFHAVWYMSLIVWYYTWLKQISWITRLCNPIPHLGL